MEVEKRHLVEVLAAHAPSCAKRPRRGGASSHVNNGTTAGGKDAFDADYHLLTAAAADNNGAITSAAGLPSSSSPFYRQQRGNSHHPESASFQELKFASEHNVPDVGERHLSIDSAFLGDNEEEEEEEENEVKNINDDLKHRRHLKTSCSFSSGNSTASQEVPYFLATKSRCLSYGFQIDNRCVAL